VLAGLGVGGLAVALAARDSLANLLGSMLIMIEKPFRVGHYVRVSGGEGTVEDVGFRSTRIRRSPWPALSEDSDDICTRGAGSIGNVRWFQSDPEQRRTP
jgi:MscS family membrane protein